MSKSPTSSERELLSEDEDLEVLECLLDNLEEELEEKLELDERVLWWLGI